MTAQPVGCVAHYGVLESCCMHHRDAGEGDERKCEKYARCDDGGRSPAARSRFGGGHSQLTREELERLRKEALNRRAAKKALSAAGFSWLRSSLSGRLRSSL